MTDDAKARLREELEAAIKYMHPEGLEALGGHLSPEGRAILTIIAAARAHMAATQVPREPTAWTDAKDTPT